VARVQLGFGAPQPAEVVGDAVSCGGKGRSSEVPPQKVTAGKNCMKETLLLPKEPNSSAVHCGMLCPTAEPCRQGRAQSAPRNVTRGHGRIGHCPTGKHPSRVLPSYHEASAWLKTKRACSCQIIWSLHGGGRGEGGAETPSSHLWEPAAFKR